MLNVTNTNELDKNYASSKHTIEIQFRIYDSQGNMDIPELKIEALEITVGGNSANVNDKSLSRNGDIYTLILEGITGDGDLNVAVKKDAIKDYVENGNDRTSLLPNEKADIINNITIDNTATEITLTATPEDVSSQAIEANANNGDGKKTEINLEVSDLSGIYSYTFEIQDKYNLKEVITKTETLTESYNEQETTYTLQTTFGIYNVSAYNIQDRAGNIIERIEPIQVFDYTIKTKEEMKIFQQYVSKGETFEGKTVTLLNDIDLQGSEDNQWTPIGTWSNPFKGTFEGQGYTISGIYINNLENNQGLFGCLREEDEVEPIASIKNLSVNGTINAWQFVGGIVGRNYQGIVENCYNSSATDGAQGIGGVVGYNQRGTIRNCYNIATISNGDYTGGITGYNNNGTIMNSYNIGIITTEGTNKGQVVGYNLNGTITNCYYNSEINNITDAYATPKTTAEMKNGSLVELLGIDNWKEDTVPINNDYPILKWQEGRETVIVEVEKVTMKEITVKATATDENYTFYEFILKQDGELKEEKIGQEKEYTFKNLEPDTDYTIEVYAYTDNTYNEETKLSPKKLLQIKTLKAVEIDLVAINNDNTISPNHANKTHTIELVFNENCDETIKVDSSKIKVMIDGNEIVKSNTENTGYSMDMTQANNQVVLTLKGIETEGILSVLLNQGALYTETGRENIEMLFDANTNYGTEQNQLKLDIEIDNTLPQIAIRDVNTDVIVESTTKTVTAEEKIAAAKEFDVQRIINITNLGINDDKLEGTEMKFHEFMAELMKGETFENTKVILHVSVDYCKGKKYGDNAYAFDKDTMYNSMKETVFKGYFDGQGNRISYSEAFYTTDSTGNSQSTIYDPLFTELGEGGVITDVKLILNNSNVTGYYRTTYDEEKAQYEMDDLGSLSLVQTNNGLIDNCRLTNYTRNGSTWGTEIVPYKDSTAPFAINNNGIIANCSTDDTMRIHGTVINNNGGTIEDNEDCAGICVNNLEEGLIYNCSTRGSIKHSLATAGICVDNDGIIIGCKNYAQVETHHETRYPNSICWRNDGYIEFCLNEGDVIRKFSWIQS